MSPPLHVSLFSRPCQYSATRRLHTRVVLPYPLSSTSSLPACTKLLPLQARSTRRRSTGQGEACHALHVASHLAPRPLPSHPARRPSFPPRHLRHVGVAKASGVLLDGRPSSTPPRFHGPAPRSPLHRLAVRLRHSRSNTSTEYSLPGATQLSQVRLTSLATTFTLRSRSHTFNKPQHRILPQVRNMYSRLRLIRFRYYLCCFDYLACLHTFKCTLHTHSSVERTGRSLQVTSTGTSIKRGTRGKRGTEGRHHSSNSPL